MGMIVFGVTALIVCNDRQPETEDLEMKFRPSFIGILLIIVGIVFAIMGGRILKNANASSAWPTVQGEVTKSKVEKKTERVKRDGVSRVQTTFSANVQYRYAVEGLTYSGGKVSFGDHGGSQEHARQVVSRYPVGKTVEVFYDPQKPEAAVLESGAAWSSYLVLGIGMGSIIAGIAACMGMGRSRSRIEL